MPELQLKVMKNNGDSVFGKAISNFNRVIYSSGNNFYSFIIGMKRNSLLKAFAAYEECGKIVDEEKRNNVEKKYEKAYENYLSTLEKYITETIYTKVQKKAASLRESDILSKYYEVISLKGNEYVEYKHKRQILLLGMEWEPILSTKNAATVEKYKKFYIITMEKLYKAIMRHYAVILTDTQNIDESKYGKIYTLIEEYIKYVLPYTEDSKEKETMLEGYKKYISTIDVYSKKVYSEIKKNMLLLELSRYLFMYSLPMIAAEQCYIKLIKDARTGIVNNYIEADKFQLYQLLLDIIESYNVNILSQKVYWESSKERDEYNKFLNEFKETKKLERIDFDEYARKREVLFITNDIKMLNKSKKKYDEIKAYYRERMIIMHGFRRLKNSFKQMPGKWRTRRRKESDE